MNRPPLRLITTFGLGHVRPASGTWGSMPPVVLAAGLLLAGFGPHQQPWVYNGVLIAVLVVFAGACIVSGDEAEARFLNKDPSQVVADETAGQCIPLLFLPGAAFGSPMMSAFTLVYVFLCFRVLDIVKPWPANRIQSVPGGWGILLDDLVAGVYALVLVQLSTRLLL